MKHCPNPSCPFALKHRRAAEYQAHATVCSDCGGALVEGAETKVAAPVSTDGSRDVLRRLVVTLGALALASLGGTLPVPSMWLPEVGLFDPRETPTPWLAFGITPFVTGFCLVEIALWAVPPWRAIRNGDGLRRSASLVAALVLGAGLVILQSWSFVLTSRLSESGAIGVSLVHLALPVLAWQVSRHGLANGWLVLWLADVGVGLTTWVRHGSRWSVAEDDATFRVVLLLGAMGLGVALVRQVASHRRVKTPSALPIPPLGIAAAEQHLALMGAVLPVQTALRLPTEAVAWPMRLAVLAWCVTLVVVLVLRPKAIANIWARWRSDLDAVSLQLAIRNAAPRLVSRLVLVTAITVATSTWLAGHQPGSSTLLALEVPLAMVILADVLAELAGRRRLGALVPIRRIARPLEVEPIQSRLEREGIASVTRGFGYLACSGILAAHAPCELLVAPADVAKANEVLR